MEELEKALRYLNDVKWPTGLPVRYNVTRDYIVLQVKKLDWILLPEVDVIRATDIVNKTMTWLNTNGYPARLEVE